MPSELPAGPAQFLARISRLMADCPADGSAAALFLEEVRRSFPVTAWLACKDRTGAVSWTGPSPDQGEPFPLKVAREEGGLLHAAFESGQESLVAADAIPARTPERRFLSRSRAGTWAFLPAGAMGETVACLVIAGTDGDMAAGLLDPIREALPMAALALQAGRLHRELDTRVDKRTEEISLLYDVSRSLGFVLNADDLFHLVATSISRVIDIDMVALTVLLPGDRRFSLRLTGPASLSAIRWIHREAMAEVARLTGERPGRIALNVTGPERPADQAPLRAGEIGSVVHVPLVIRAQVAGLLSVASREPGAFGPARMRLVYTISNQASLTLDRISTAREAEASRMHSMLESMADGVLLLDRELRIVMSNPAAQTHLTALTGRFPSTLTALGDVRLRSLFEHFDQTGSRPRSFEIPPTAEGRVFSVTCSPVRGEGGVQGMAVLLSDVTEARMLQLQFAQSEKLSALGEMISGVAHELNNPLASVMGFAQLLQTEQVDESVRKKVVAIDAEATRCQKVVQNLLRFARHHAPERRPVDIHAALDSVLQLLGHQLQVDDITVVLDLDASPRPVMGDLHLLQQVFMNIIYNAYQAMKEKKSPGRLTLRTRNRADLVVIEITDDGPGIAPANLKRIFDPFFSTKEVGKGTGLGLSLAYGTIREHGGEISARSVLGAGTTFIVELPAGTEMPAVVVVEEPSMGPAASTTGKRILVVEDEGSLADVMAEFLAGCGHHVDKAGDGNCARSLISSVKYDLIISDLKMPNMNGREFYRHVAGIDPGLARRIIFSTGDTASKETQSFFEEVGNAVLSKPFNLRDLIHLVDKVLAAS